MDSFGSVSIHALSVFQSAREAKVIGAGVVLNECFN